MPVLSTVAAACARAWGFTAGDLFAGAALALDFDETTTLDSRITFTRATSATYFDSSGVLQTASSGVARFDHRLEGGVWVNKGLLIEEQRTNLLFYSEQFDQGGAGNWILARLTVTANDTTAPDGNTTADALFETTDNGSHSVVQNKTVGTTTTHAFSVFAKANGRNVVRLQHQSTTNNISALYDLSDQSITSSATGTGVLQGASIEDVGDGWYRLTLTGYSGQTSTNFLINIALDDGTLVYTGDDTKGIYIWGAQLEAGAFPTSYIETTTTASVTRNADQASITGTDFSNWYNATEGTLFNQFACLGDISSSGWVAARIVSISDDTLNERIQLTVNNTPSISSLASDGGVIQANLTNTPSLTTANTTYKYSFAYKANDFADSLDGATVNTDTSGSLPSPNRMYIGAAPVSGSTNFLNGHLAKFYYWNTRKSNNFLTSITS